MPKLQQLPNTKTHIFFLLFKKLKMTKRRCRGPGKPAKKPRHRPRSRHNHPLAPTFFFDSGPPFAHFPPPLSAAPFDHSGAPSEEQLAAAPFDHSGAPSEEQLAAAPFDHSGAPSEEQLAAAPFDHSGAPSEEQLVDFLGDNEFDLIGESEDDESSDVSLLFGDIPFAPAPVPTPPPLPAASVELPFGISFFFEKMKASWFSLPKSKQDDLMKLGPFERSKHVETLVEVKQPTIGWQATVSNDLGMTPHYQSKSDQNRLVTVLEEPGDKVKDFVSLRALNAKQVGLLDSLPLSYWMRAIDKKAAADAAKAERDDAKAAEAEAKVSKSSNKAKAGAHNANTKTKRQFRFVDRGFSSGHCPDRARDQDAIVTPRELDGSKDPESLELFEKLSAVISEFEGGGWNVS
jgi:hypothetical protein